MAVVIDLYSRKIVGWAMQSRQPTDLVLQALLMAVWRRKPTSNVLIHSPSRDHATHNPVGQWIKERSSAVSNGH
ncbi:MAG: IS3 family transposase, partial [Rhodobacteraceae bacterium]|nr:IS3 family transposase [Paracoccaceae bacterium]